MKHLIELSEMRIEKSRNPKKLQKPNVLKLNAYFRNLEIEISSQKHILRVAMVTWKQEA